MRVVHKFPVPISGATSEITLPVGAMILHFDAQGDELFIWALVDPEEEIEVRFFFIVGTGHPLLHRIAAFL